MSDSQAQILSALQEQFRQLDPGLPIALFPVRIQVRFATSRMVDGLLTGDLREDLTGDPPAELWVRIYPDDIFVHTHEEKINEEEMAAAREYWDTLWESVEAGDSEADRLRIKEGAWQSLSEDLGNVRSRWVILQARPPAVDAAGFPTAPPELPELDLSPDSWNEAPRTYLLPDRFVIRLEENGRIREFAGNPIVKQDGALILGIDPNKSDEYSDTPAGRNIPEEIRWMVDFQQAVDIGMGVRIPLTTEEQSGFDRLYVLGWHSQLDQTAAVTLLETLFENHRYKVGGMDLIPPGTPTNNTREQSVPLGPDELSAEVSLALEEEGDGDDLLRLARSMGLPADSFSGLDHSQSNAVQAGLDIHDLLFDATLGQAIAFWHNSLSESTRNELKAYMGQWVSGRGLLPTLRIEDQPYAFLPALAFSHYKTDSGLIEDPFLRNLWTNILHPLDDWFFDQLDRVPHMHRNLGSLQGQTTFLSILQSHPTSVSYRQRFALDQTFFSVNEDDLPDELAILAEKEADTDRIAAIGTELDGLGFPQPDGLGQLIFDQAAYPLGTQREEILLGIEGLVIPPLEGSDQNYLQWLTTAELSDIRDEQIPGGQVPKAVLYKLLRYLLLQRGGDQAVRDRISELALLPVAELRLLLQEHLDCITYRLDAWIGGLAGVRLEEIRQTSPEGIHIGAWGYLENVRPRGSSSLPGEFIPAPSMRHATAAAVLRSGFQANKSSGENEEDDLFAVNLTSTRVKDALFLLEGVRNGQDLAALLGYRLERAMQEYRDGNGRPILAELIYDLRNKYPFKVEPLVQTGESAPAEVEEDFSQRVINALDLLEDQDDWESGLEPAPTTDQARALDSLLDELDGNLDSVKDLLAAEGVYQLVDGQMDRAKAALDALTEGDQLITPEIANTPRSSLPLTFRMGIMLPEKTNGRTVTWPGSPTPRSTVNPSVNRWLFDRLPDINRIRVRARWQLGEDEEGAPVYEEKNIGLRDLLIQPIDLVFMMHLQREKPEASELRFRIEEGFRKRFNLPLTQRIEILDDDRTGFRSSEYTLLAVEPLAAGLGKMLLETRSLQPEDFLQANSEAKQEAAQLWEPELLRHQLRQVTLELEQNLQQFGSVLESVKERLDSGADIDETRLNRNLSLLRDHLLFYAALGWVHAVPTQVEALNRLTLEQHYRRAENIFREANSRMTQAKDLIVQDSPEDLSKLLLDLPGGTPQEAVDILEAITELHFGRFYRVFPEFRIPNSETVAQSLQDTELKASQANFAADRWVQTQAPVRPLMDQYYRSAMLSELFGNLRDFGGLEVVQLPIRDGRAGPWVGFEYGDFEPHADTLALTLELQKDFDLGHDTFSGILIDNWNELIPDPTANTGIALQYDQPDMESPNAVLLALTHTDNIGWEWENLAQTVADTVLMAKKRAVDPDLLKESFWDQLLPGLLGPVFTGEETGDALNFGSLPAEAMEQSSSDESTEAASLDLSSFGLSGVDLGNIAETEDTD